jgi:hypothetical protein
LSLAPGVSHQGVIIGDLEGWKGGARDPEEAPPDQQDDDSAGC